MSATPVPLPSVADVRDVVTEVAGAVLEREIDTSLDLFDQGATSLAFIRIVTDVGERYGIEVRVEDLEEATVQLVADLVVLQIGERQPVAVEE